MPKDLDIIVWFEWWKGGVECWFFMLRDESPLTPSLTSLHHSPTHPPTHSPTHSLTHSLTHSRTHELTNSLTNSLTHELTHSRTHSLTHELTHELNSLTLPLTHSPTHELKNSRTQELIHPLTHSPTHSPFHSPFRSHPLTHELTHELSLRHRARTNTLPAHDELTTRELPTHSRTNLLTNANSRTLCLPLSRSHEPTRASVKNTSLTWVDERSIDR